MVHLRSVLSGPVLASLSTATTRTQRRVAEHRSLQLIQGSLSARKVERQSPWLAGLHRISTGFLAGLGLSVVGLSALTLHWQNQWASSYGQLEAAKSLEHRLQESAAVLEQHHLSAVKRPGQLVPTSSEKLIHISEPVTIRRNSVLPLLAGIQLGRIPAGF